MANLQSKIERQLSRKKKIDPVDFRKKDTIRKIQIQWNRMSESQKQQVPAEQLDYVLDMAESNLKSTLFEEVARIYNKQQSKNLPISRGQKIANTRKLNKIAKEQADLIRIKETIAKTGVRADTGAELLIEVGNTKIPNPNMIDVELEDIIKDRKENNKRLPPSDRTPEQDMFMRTVEEYNEYKKTLKEFGAKDAQKKLRKIERESLREVYAFVDTYFKDTIYTEELAKVKQYLKYMTPKQRYDIRAVLQSEKFRKEYDSDQDNNPEFDHTVMQMTRLSDILKIMQNETGKIPYKDKAGRKRMKNGPKTEQSSKYNINNFI